MLDEADAALDKQNTKRVADLLHKQSRSAQFICISHNDTLIKEADRVYGVSIGPSAASKSRRSRTSMNNN